ncbi:DHA2 family efflux MFS transporter permease subunit [Amycolatopsis suaedae]|uniref:DHA2 family efflux MFS transporter permease subunit n=1 Tax=Amycolatopsis suaedae TaxID=2510978 RepID=A0A4Q7JCV6_9PSEU|nr:DHA2 family efflux MFS transporter permease subunit [Amycolatopsis suaedae]RZQ65199.1 DHA2 family efflux MFS transporter permease subunit [Amycolatopsis suaedae]
MRLTLLVVSTAQLLVVLDGTIVNIALPSAQAALGMTDATRQWAITAYALAFGGLLLIGGRISSALGHRRTFMAGLAGFAAASALGGAAVTPEMLFAARALQGVFAAALAPAGLSLLTTTFTEPRERGRAFGVFAAVGAAGSAVGLVAGGLLTEFLSWRWCLYINVPVVLLALLLSTFVPRDEPVRGGRLDVAGALLSTAGFGALVYGFAEAESLGWTAPPVLGLLVLGVLLLVAFVAVELRVTNPMLPMRILADRARGAAFTSITLLFVSMMGYYLFLSYYAQTVLGYSPVAAGMTLIIHATAALLAATLLAGRLQHRVPAVALVLPGLLAAAIGTFVLTFVGQQTDGVFWPYLVPSLLLTGLGMGCVLPPTASLATSGMEPRDIGAASAAFNAAQQLGGALGVALLNTVAVSTGTYGAALTVGTVVIVLAAAAQVPRRLVRRA